MEILDLTASELAAKVQARELSARAVVDAHLGEIERRDARIGAFLTVDPERVRAEADAIQARVDAGEALPLAGVPVAIKDNISTEGIATTCASKILRGYVPPYDATVIQQVRAAGGIVIGKTNLDEFAMGASTETSAYHLTRNPWDLERSPGGSSGGSAAAVAAGFAPLSLGSDTGGSIRQPASLCGIVGFKPTYGRASRYGLVAFGSSLDQIGPFGNTVTDVARLAAATTGHDPLDSTSLQTPPIDLSQLEDGRLAGLRIAVPDEMLGDATEPGVRAVIEAVIARAIAAGATVDRVSIPSIKLGVTTYYIIAPAEASSNLGRFDGIRYGPRPDNAAAKGHIGLVEQAREHGFGPEVKTRIMIGTYALSAGYYDAYYLRAQQVRAVMRQEFEGIFHRYDVVLGPTSPCVAFRIGDLNDDPLAMKLLDACTIPANMGGFPAISLNGGFADGLPVGVQLMGPVLADEELLRIARALERELPDASRRAPRT
ncbi:MAG: Asp-tRNA(Asn)/Glu-tRNA(Gln) amidotransferase subunit GatA [Fimbriimonadaceae bacterium]|nr:Asp-tRNA(Asn)/Glu-tRNA(Gln) amidotransferase subunit GatA [Fimbriimonadaceae bacterium]